MLVVPVLQEAGIGGLWFEGSLGNYLGGNSRKIAV
jgi:hypothetical protein